jgi:hypothetical protein
MGSTHKLCVSFVDFCILVCPLLVTAPIKNGSVDFDDFYVKRCGLARESFVWGSQRFQKPTRVSFYPEAPKLGQEEGFPA